MDWPSANLVTSVLTALLTAGAALGAVIVGNKLSYVRTYNEKLWDLKRLAYGLILSELAAIEQVCGIADSYIEEDEDRYFLGEFEVKHKTEIAKHFASIAQRMADDYLILSEEFIALYDKFSEDSDSDPYESDPPADYKRLVAALRKYRPLLIELARREITLRRKNAWH
jgi:hypothetical protein